MGAPVSLVLNHLRTILDTLNPDTPDTGCPLTPAPCRVALYPGDTVAYDTCQSESCSDGDGQLFANIVSITNRTSADAGGSCREWVVTARVGIVRCGPLPDADADEIEAAATQQGIDADTILNALTCCDDMPREIRDLFTPMSWAAISEQGGCVGGEWTIVAVIGDCCP